MSETPLPARRPFDFAAYAKRVQNGPCFVCATVDRHPDYGHELVYEDPDTIAFLARHPTLLGYCLVAPKRHVERLESELQIDEYLRVQEVVYWVAKAVAGAVPTERIYVLSLGSQQGNAHVHWHVAPLPPHVSYEEQQFHALMAEHGVLDIPTEVQQTVARNIRKRM
jgi:diadenosine tetraphosphate (Ap4A) HIT family hydrolase